MIVRCTNCNSAFAVDDVKVEDKKFAFTCPKCENENIIDNRKQSPSAIDGQAVVDEAFDEADQPSLRKEAAVSTGTEDYFEKSLSTKAPDRTAARDMHDTEEPILEDSSLIDSDDLSGLAEPERMDEMETAIDGSELPPADDMRSDTPLDDLALDEELKDLDIHDSGPDKDDIFLDAELSNAKKDERKTTFEELGEELGEYKPESDLILDEMESQEEAGEPVKLEEIDDIDTLLAADEKEKEIIDDFEPLELDNAPAVSKPLASELILDEEIKTEEMFRAEDAVEDESITIDLDTLDIELEEDGKAAEQGKAEKVPGVPGAGMTKTASSRDGASDEDENITIDLDTLDIDLQEVGEVSKGEGHEKLDLDLSDFSEETIQELEGVSHAPKTGDDEDIKLDLDSLDISLEESDEIQQGESLDDDEKLTLEDAGLTLEELTTDELTSVSPGSHLKDDTDENVRLNIDDIDKDLDLQTIEMELKEAESILADSRETKGELPIIEELSDLPDIDFIEEPGPVGIAARPSIVPISRTEDDLMKLDDTDRVIPRKGGLQAFIPDIAAKGAVNFSIDYSIKYSRIGAALRLFGLFLIGLIPHFVVFFVYNLLSLILGFINHIVVIATEKNVEDFSGIHENTLRYLLSISASAIGIIEEMPIFTGRDNIDYPLQMRIVFPLRSSRLLAFLRLSGIGIVILTLPHLLIMGILSIVIPLVSLVGLVSVLVTGGWPHILFDFMTRYYRYTARVLAFSIGIIDEYPRFKFD